MVVAPYALFRVGCRFHARGEMRARRWPGREWYVWGAGTDVMLRSARPRARDDSNLDQGPKVMRHHRRPDRGHLCDSAAIRALFIAARQARLTIGVAAAGPIKEILLKVSGLDQITTVVTLD
jgi:hypothetical protein